MINVIIYLKKEHNSEKLVELLLSKKLIASASIDMDNVSYKIMDEVVVKEVFNVITAQSKALLFNSIVQLAENVIGESIAISSTPIVGANGFFNETVRSKTIPI
jgi:hypothetical protein